MDQRLMVTSPLVRLGWRRLLYQRASPESTCTVTTARHGPSQEFQETRHHLAHPGAAAP